MSTTGPMTTPDSPLAKQDISIEDFAKVDLRLGTVKTAERVPKTDKLVKLQVNFGSFERQIVAGIGKVFQPEDLLGKQFLFVVNLAPRSLRGVESHGMVLAANLGDGGLGLLSVPTSAPDGTPVG